MLTGFKTKYTKKEIAAMSMDERNELREYLNKNILNYLNYITEDSNATKHNNPEYKYQVNLILLEVLNRYIQSRLLLDSKVF